MRVRRPDNESSGPPEDISSGGAKPSPNNALSRLNSPHLTSGARAGAADDLAGLVALAAGVDGVDGVEVRLGRRLDDVGRGGAAAEGAGVALDLQFKGDLALRVLARR